MDANKHYIEIIEEIESITKNNFDINILRQLLLLKRKTELYYEKKKLSIYLTKDIRNRINNIMQKKLLELNPTLSKTTLEKTTEILKRGYNALPKDIAIINNDIVLYYEEAFDNPYTNETLVLSGNEQKYKKLTTEKLLSNVNNKALSNEEKQILFYIIIQINDLLNSTNKEPHNFYFNKEHCNFTSNYQIYLSHSLKEIIESIIQNQDIQIKLIAFQDWDDFHYYEINQTTYPNNSFIWKSKKIIPETWTLSESLKQHNKKLALSPNNNKKNDS